MLGVVAAAKPVAMTAAVSPAFYVALGLYAAAAVLFVGAFTKRPAQWVRVARWLLLVAFVSHGADISWRGFADVHPGTSVREAVGFVAWLMVGGYLVADYKIKLGVLGALVSPIALCMLAAARLSPSGAQAEGISTLGRIHITLASTGVAIFALATAVSGMYLLAERNLKRKKFEGLLFRRGVALETLDRLNHRLILAGFPVFTMALMLGVVWVSQRKSDFDRPEYPIALFTWGAFAWLIIGRSTRGWRGRKAALLTLAGFSAALVVLGMYFLRRAMG